MEKLETQVLKYVYICKNDITMVGPVRIKLKLASDAMDTFIIACLSDEDERGNVNKLTYGNLRAATRTIDKKRSNPSRIGMDYSILQPLKPGKPFILEFSMIPTTNFFKKGHKIVIEIASRTDVVAPSLQDGFIYFQKEEPPYLARNFVIYGKDTFVEFDILD